RDDTAGERPAHDVRQAAAYGEERDDHLRRIAEARVQEAADPGPGVLGRLFGRLPDQPCERDERKRGQQEERDVSHVEGEVGEEGERREGEGGPEDLPRHADTLAAVLEAVLFDWGDTLMQFAYDPELEAAGQQAGLEAIGWANLPQAPALVEHFRDHYVPM